MSKEKGKFKCPDCHCATDYLDSFEEKYTKKKYSIHWRVKCPKCYTCYIIREYYKLEEIEVIL